MGQQVTQRSQQVTPWVNIVGPMGYQVNSQADQVNPWINLSGTSVQQLPQRDQQVIPCRVGIPGTAGTASAVPHSCDVISEKNPL